VTRLRTALGWLFRAVAVAAALLATAQPVLGAFAFFRRADPVNYEQLHLVFGAILYNLAIVLAVLAALTRFRRRWILLVISVLQYGLLHTQLRLGLGSNEDVVLLAYHIPLGVLIFLVTYLTVALAFGAHFASSRS
jgi:hypothetical protein